MWSFSCSAHLRILRAARSCKVALTCCPSVRTERKFVPSVFSDWWSIRPLQQFFSKKKVIPSWQGCNSEEWDVLGEHLRLRGICPPLQRERCTFPDIRAADVVVSVSDLHR